MQVWCKCGTVWYSLVQCGTVWYSVVQCGTVWYSVVQFGTVWCKCGARVVPGHQDTKPPSY